MRDLGRLTATKIAKLSKPGRYADGGSLYLQIAKGGSKSWILRYQLAGRVHDMGLGGFPAIGLADAREKARKARSLLIDGDDPLTMRREKKDAHRGEMAKRISFKEAAEKYIAAHKPGWKNGKHADQWTATLQTYAFPVVGSLSVAAVDTGHVMRVLEPIWKEKGIETASRLRGRIEAVLDWAKARHYRSGDNPARWRGHLDKLLPKKTKVRKVRHQPAMDFTDVPAFMTELQSQNSVSARALEFTILTAVRTGEAINARKDEINLHTKVWTIPEERTKANREHRVPLSERAVALLKALPREKDSDWVFLGGRARKPLSNMAMLELLRQMRPGLTVHGFRSSFRDWCAEQTNFPREVAETALGHVLGDKTEAAYRRGDALEKRRRLMQAWAGFCSGPAKVAGSNVRSIGSATV